MSKLVIVESPAKARTIEKYLGSGYHVEASVGHVRDLAQPSSLPETKKHGPFGKFAVDVEHDFTPYYVVSDDKKKTVTKLKQLLKEADELLLATDEDREGEAIAWHLLEVLKPKVEAKRMVFHEITKDAIVNALENTRDLNIGLVDAQETRRILDRLVGYEVSPLLWRKIAPGLSAGRVQSVATRLIVERERERMKFKPCDFWSVEATLSGTDAKGPQAFTAKLIQIDNWLVAQSRDLGDDGKLLASAAKKQVRILDEQVASSVASALKTSPVKVTKQEDKPYRRRPSAPFTTSTLQQEASRKLRLSSQETMRVAQQLYENGYITYMRTDSTALSAQAIAAARQTAVDLYGEKCIPENPRIYGTTSKGAQEAHEAIRPAGSVFRTPAQVAAERSRVEADLYALIWQRTVASQMIDATGVTATLTLESALNTAEVKSAVLTAAGTVITQPGFRQAYQEGRDKTRYDEAEDSKQTLLPELTVGQSVDVLDALAAAHTTRPPERYTDATLVKKMEELGIGRPSTYASTISRILNREYAYHRGQALVPSWLAFSVVRLLEENLPGLIDYTFTAHMEQELDKIASGSENRVSYLTNFWRGGGAEPGLEAEVEQLGDIDARAVNSIDLGNGVTLRIGKFGPYLEGSTLANKDGEILRANVPATLAPDELTLEKAQELLEKAAAGDQILGTNPENGRDIVVKDGRFGAYFEEVLPADAPKDAVAKRGSLFKSMTPSTVTLEQALQVLSLPRILGQIDGQDVQALNGRYGPYISWGKESRSLSSEEELFTITLEQATELLSKPRTRGAAKTNQVLKELGVDPVTEGAVTLKNGRFGYYVTDGTTNASLRTVDDPETITPQRAWELLALRREKLAAAEASGKKTAKTKKAATKTTAKKATTASKKTKTAATKVSTRTKKAAAEEIL